MTGAFWNDPAIILLLLLIILVADNLWALYLHLREIFMVYQVKDVPAVLQPYLPQELFSRMRAIKLHRSWFIIVNTLFAVVICGCLELYFGLFPFVWDLADKCAIWKWMQHELWMSFIFVLLLTIYINIKTLPGKIYDSFCIPKLIVRPKPSWGQRILNEFLDTLVSVLMMALVVAAVVALVRYSGPYSILALYLLSLLLTVSIIIVLPFLINSMFGKRVPLENTVLKFELEQLTRQVGFPMRHVHIIRVRDPNAGSNAFFYGSCCLKRIVIFDTLLLNRGVNNPERLPPGEVGKGLRNQQVLAVVAHELGHWKSGHFYKAIIIFQVHLLLSLLLFAFCFPHGPIYQAVGFEIGLQPIIVGFVIIFGYVMTPYFTISNVLMLTMTRQFEYQADKFAFKLGHAANLRLALLKLYADNLSYPISDPCFSSWHHTHPTMLHRLQRLEYLEATQS